MTLTNNAEIYLFRYHFGVLICEEVNVCYEATVGHRPVPTILYGKLRKI
jgi:hypothetical protein